MKILFHIAFLLIISYRNGNENYENNLNHQKENDLNKSITVVADTSSSVKRVRNLLSKIWDMRANQTPKIDPVSLEDDWDVHSEDEFLCNAKGDVEIPDDFPSIQAGINAAHDGDTIIVAPGIYKENIYLNGKNITLRSKFCCQKDQKCIERTVIDGAGQTVITIGSEGIYSKIEGFTIQNGDDGIAVNSNVSILGNYILNNNDGIDYESGGGICDGNIIKFNKDDGIDLDGPVEVVISNNIIDNNRDDGLEIRLHKYKGSMLNIVIRRNIISGNQEDGLQLIDYPGISDRIFRIERNIIINNAMVGIGLMSGGNTVEDFSAAPVPERIFIVNNTFDGNNHGVTGGANLICLNNIFESTPGIALKNVSGNSIASHNLFWNNGLDFKGANIDLTGTLFSDPFLNFDYSLHIGSPAIDAGAEIFEWQGEIVFAMPKGSYSGRAPDLGAYERR